MRKLIAALWERARAYDRIRLPAGHYPREAKGILSVETVLRSGALPVGTKAGDRLCVACLERLPGAVQDQLMREASERTGKQLRGMRRYSVPIEDFVDVLAAVHGVDEARLKSLSPEALAPPLRRYVCTGGAFRSASP